MVGRRHGKQATTWVPNAVKQMNVLPFLYINKGQKECAKTLSINKRNIACKGLGFLVEYIWHILETNVIIQKIGFKSYLQLKMSIWNLFLECTF